MTNDKCEIPIDQIDAGLRLCSGNVRRLIEDHCLLMRDASQWHALALCIYALEELLKYRILKTERTSALASGKSQIEVDGRIFGRGKRSHYYKLELARKLKLIPEDAWIINTTKFDNAYFDSAYFDTEDVIISATLRLENIFVDWKNGKWVHGTTLEPVRLKDFADSIINVLNAIEAET